MLLSPAVTVSIREYSQEFYLSAMFCPKCGNQTLYHSGVQGGSQACVNCHSFWQIRSNTRPDGLEHRLFEMVTVKELDEDEKH